MTLDEARVRSDVVIVGRVSGWRPGLQYPDSGGGVARTIFVEVTDTVTEQSVQVEMSLDPLVEVSSIDADLPAEESAFLLREAYVNDAGQPVYVCVTSGWCGISHDGREWVAPMSDEVTARLAEEPLIDLEDLSTAEVTP